MSAWVARCSAPAAETPRSTAAIQRVVEAGDRTYVLPAVVSNSVTPGSGRVAHRHNDEFRVITPRRAGTLDFQAPRTLFSVGLSASNAYETRSFDVTRDGSRILAIRIPPANRSRQIEIVTNWVSEVSRLAPLAR